jgi:hypothetical protein
MNLAEILRTMGTPKQCGERLSQFLEPNITSEIFQTQSPSLETLSVLSNIVRTTIRDTLVELLPGLLDDTLPHQDQPSPPANVGSFRPALPESNQSGGFGPEASERQNSSLAGPSTAAQISEVVPSISPALATDVSLRVALDTGFFPTTTTADASSQSFPSMVFGAGVGSMGGGSPPIRRP